jgi:hypothetical protein
MDWALIPQVRRSVERVVDDAGAYLDMRVWLQWLGWRRILAQWHVASK